MLEYKASVAKITQIPLSPAKMNFVQDNQLVAILLTCASGSSGFSGLFQFKTLTIGQQFMLENMYNKLLTNRHGQRKIQPACFP